MLLAVNMGRRIPPSPKEQGPHGRTLLAAAPGLWSLLLGTKMSQSSTLVGVDVCCACAGPRFQNGGFRFDPVGLDALQVDKWNQEKAGFSLKISP